MRLIIKIPISVSLLVAVFLFFSVGTLFPIVVQGATAEELQATDAKLEFTHDSRTELTSHTRRVRLILRPSRTEDRQVDIEHLHGIAARIAEKELDFVPV